MSQIGRATAVDTGRRGREGARRHDAFREAGDLDELPPGRSKEVEHDGRIYALFNVDGVISAIDGICPHQGGPLADGSLHGTMVSCPWHGWEFDVRTGRTTLNSRLRQPVFEVKVEGPDVLVAIP